MKIDIKDKQLAKVAEFFVELDKEHLKSTSVSFSFELISQYCGYCDKYGWTPTFWGMRGFNRTLGLRKLWRNGLGLA